MIIAETINEINEVDLYDAVSTAATVLSCAHISLGCARTKAQQDVTFKICQKASRVLEGIALQNYKDAIKACRDIFNLLKTGEAPHAFNLAEAVEDLLQLIEPTPSEACETHLELVGAA